MGMRLLQSMRPAGRAGQIKYIQVHSNPDTGACERVEVEQCAVLPDAKQTDLGLLIKAGVPLEQVNCKLINPSGKIGLADTKPAETNKTDDKE